MARLKSTPALGTPATASAVNPNHLFLLDIPTAAARMSTTVFAVRELCRSGQMKFVPIGHKWLISPGAIQEFIRTQEQTA